MATAVLAEWSTFLVVPERIVRLTACAVDFTESLSIESLLLGKRAKQQNFSKLQAMIRREVHRACGSICSVGGRREPLTSTRKCVDRICVHHQFRMLQRQSGLTLSATAPGASCRAPSDRSELGSDKCPQWSSAQESQNAENDSPCCCACCRTCSSRGYAFTWGCLILVVTFFHDEPPS